MHGIYISRIQCQQQAEGAPGDPMEMILSPPRKAALSVTADPESIDVIWIDVAERLPDDGECVQVMLEHSLEVRNACRGHYQSTSAWFDAESRTPIYDTILRWRVDD